MSRLAIRLLGTYQVALDGRPLTAFETEKARALLAFLAVEADRPHRRQFLTTLFWPELPTPAARNNLRQSLYRLRRCLADGQTAVPRLLVDAHDVRFNPAAGLWLDAAEFADHVQTWQAHHPMKSSMCTDCCERLRAAAVLFRGDLLAGFTLPDCPEFEWWLLSRQERYHRLALEALEALGRHCEEVEDYAGAARYAEKVIMLEPWLESAHRRQMRALALSGQRHAALAHYEQCSRILAEQMDTEPSPRTTRLYEQIQAGELKR